MAVSNMSDFRCMSYCRSRVEILIPVWSNNFVETDHEVISMIFSSILLIYSRRLIVRTLCMKYWLTACSNLPSSKKKCG